MSIWCTSYQNRRKTTTQGDTNARDGSFCKELSILTLLHQKRGRSDQSQGPDGIFRAMVCYVRRGANFIVKSFLFLPFFLPFFLLPFFLSSPSFFLFFFSSCRPPPGEKLPCILVQVAYSNNNQSENLSFNTLTPRWDRVSKEKCAAACFFFKSLFIHLGWAMYVPGH